MAVESIELAMGASGGRGRIRRAGEETDLTDVLAGPNKADRLLPRKLRMAAVPGMEDDRSESRQTLTKMLVLLQALVSQCSPD